MRSLPVELPFREVSSEVTSAIYCSSTSLLCLWELRRWVESSPDSSAGWSAPQPCHKAPCLAAVNLHHLQENGRNGSIVDVRFHRQTATMSMSCRLRDRFGSILKHAIWEGEVALAVTDRQLLRERDKVLLLNCCEMGTEYCLLLQKGQNGLV